MRLLKDASFIFTVVKGFSGFEKLKDGNLLITG